MKIHQQNWQLFRSYAQKLTTQLGGNNILYLDDNSFQLQEDLFFENSDLQSVVDLMAAIKPPVSLETLELFPDEWTVKTTWYYDQLNSKNQIID